MGRIEPVRGLQPRTRSMTPERRTLDLVDLEPDGGEVVEWFPGQVVGGQADAYRVEQALQQPHRQAVPSDVLAEQDRAPGLSMRSAADERPSGIGDGAEPLA